MLTLSLFFSKKKKKRYPYLLRMQWYVLGICMETVELIDFGNSAESDWWEIDLSSTC